MKNKILKIYLKSLKMKSKIAFRYFYTSIIKEIMKKDRDIIEKSKKAFISFIRSYSEHEVLLSLYIF